MRAAHLVPLIIDSTSRFQVQLQLTHTTKAEQYVPIKSTQVTHATDFSTSQAQTIRKLISASTYLFIYLSNPSSHHTHHPPSYSRNSLLSPRPISQTQTLTPEFTSKPNLWIEPPPKNIPQADRTPDLKILALCKHCITVSCSTSELAEPFPLFLFFFVSISLLIQ